MNSFNQKHFNSFILDNHIIGFFDSPLRLSSNRITRWYVNWRTAGSDAFLTDQLSDFILNFIADNHIECDTIYGVPEGATKIAVITQFKRALRQKDLTTGTYVLAMGRKSPKEYGDPKDRFFVGAPKGKTIVIEDVTTTGGSLLKSVTNLKELGIEVVAAIALTNRNELMDHRIHISQELEKMKVPYYAMSEAVQLLPEAVQLYKPNQETLSEIEAEFQQYGQKPLTLR